MQAGRRSGLELSETICFRWRRIYSLAPTDDRYLDMSFEGLVTDFWAHAHANNPKLRDEEVDDDFEATLRELGLTEDDLSPAAGSPPGAEDEVLADVTYEDPAR